MATSEEMKAKRAQKKADELALQQLTVSCMCGKLLGEDGGPLTGRAPTVLKKQREHIEKCKVVQQYKKDNPIDPAAKPHKKSYSSDFSNQRPIKGFWPLTRTKLCVSV